MFVKSSLLKRYRLSPKAFRQRFRKSTKLKDASYVEFGYNLKLNSVEWLKSAKVYGDMVKVVECLCFEQFYNTIHYLMHLWILDKPDVIAGPHLKRRRSAPRNTRHATYCIEVKGSARRVSKTSRGKWIRKSFQTQREHEMRRSGERKCPDVT